MKPLALLLAIAFVCLAAEPPQKTRRVVNGQTVDLKPILEWEKLRRTLGPGNPQLPPRPMPQWERISAHRFESSTEVVVTIGNKKRFLVVKNLPPAERRNNKFVSCLALKTGQTNYVTTQKIAAAVYDHGREIE